MDKSFLDWPFFEPRHRELAKELGEWADAMLRDILCEKQPQENSPLPLAGEALGVRVNTPATYGAPSVGRPTPSPPAPLPQAGEGRPNGANGRDIEGIDAACRRLVRGLGQAGWLRLCVPGAFGGAHEALDVRSLALARETLAKRSGLADFALAMQGLGAGAISLFGSETQKRAYLPAVAAGEKIAAFALSEPDAGSDAAAMTMRMRRDGGDYVLEGEKTWISNGGIADFYTVFARTGEGPKGVSCIVVDSGAPGLSIAERMEVIAPHPLARLKFDNCRIPAANLVGQEGEGLEIALSVLDVFRTTVGAAAVGFARAALDEATAYATGRRMFGSTLSEQPLAQAMLAEMALDIDAAALLVYRAAWTKDIKQSRVTREAAMAKLFATEAAQRVVDKAVQLHGGLGVKKGSKVEELYREIRALRIYEGASEVQKLVVAREHLKGARHA